MNKRLATMGLAALLSACSNPEPTGEQPDVEPSQAAVENEIEPIAADEANREPIGYTSLRPDDCRLLEQNVEEGGYYLHLCPGIGGYALETSESDLRQGLTVIAPDGGRSELDLSSRVANGAFNALGPAAEWRGAENDAPSALIVRLNVANGAEPNLVVVRLGDPTCMVAVVPPGEGQNDRARDIADGPAKPCLKA